MAALVFLLLVSVFSFTSAQQKHSNVSLGSSLTPTGKSSWPSPSGLYAFGFFEEGNGYLVGIFMVGIPEKTVVWVANRDNPPVPSNVTLSLTATGELEVEQPVGQFIPVASPSQSAASASMLDSGNFVLYGANQGLIWQSFEHPTDSLLPGQRLQNGQALFSSASETDHSTGIFRLAMQPDGNLVQYPVTDSLTTWHAYWATGTFQLGPTITLNLNKNGSLYLANSNDIIRNLASGFPFEGKVFLMRIDSDGLLRLYSHSLNGDESWSVLWSPTKDKCDPKGLCGPNGFCVLMDDKAECSCLPGFDFVSPGKWRFGCERNFTAKSCYSKDGSMEYMMRALENTVWEDISYSVLSSKTKEECKEACLEDCNCEAVLFKDGRCSKQRLPLRFGRRSLSDDDSAFIKVATSSAIYNGNPDVPSKKSLGGSRIVLVISASLVCLAFIIVAVSMVLIYWNRTGAYKRLSPMGLVELGEEVAPRAFTHTELEQVTNGFKEELWEKEHLGLCTKALYHITRGSWP